MGRSVGGGASRELSPENDFTFTFQQFNLSVLTINYELIVIEMDTILILLFCIFFCSSKQELLCYKFQEQLHSGSERLFPMVWRRSFKSPVLSITYSDLTGDGLKELAILTLKGLHIMQVCNDH